MHYVSEYVKRELIPWLERRGLSYVFLYEDQNTKENFERYVQSADIVILTGHGTETYITGYLYYPIVQTCNNDGLLAGKQVCAVSCLSAKILGHSAVNKGALLYIGYLREATMVLSYDVADIRNAPIEQIDPLKDELAYPFLDTLFYPAKLLVDGESPKDIYEKTMDRYNWWIRYALNKKTDEWSEVAKYLMWNRDSLAIYPVYETGTSAIVPFLLSASILLPYKLTQKV